MVMQHELNSHIIIKEMSSVLKDVDIEYIAIVNREFKQIDRVEIGDTIILVACRVGDTRLIDNIWI